MSTPPDNLPPEIVAALENGNLLEAIKQLRAKRNVSLAEAKQILEAFRARSRGVAAARPTAARSTAARPTPARPIAGGVRSVVQTTTPLRAGLSPGEVPRARMQSAFAIVGAAIAAAVVA